MPLSPHEGLLLGRLRVRLVRRLRARFVPADADDLVGEAIARAIQNPPPDRRFEPWIERVLANLIQDHHRRARRWRLHPDVPECMDSAPLPDAVQALREDAAALGVAWDKLPVSSQAALSRRMEASPGAESPTERTRVRRALAQLRVLAGSARAWLLPPPATASAFASVTSGALALVLVLTPGPVAQDVGPPAGKSRPSYAVATSTAPANPVSAPPRLREPRRQRAAPVSPRPEPRVYNFEDDEVPGQIESPGSDLVVVHTPGPRPSLIEIPRDFVAAIVKSLDDL